MKNSLDCIPETLPSSRGQVNVCGRSSCRDFLNLTTTALSPYRDPVRSSRFMATPLSYIELSRENALHNIGQFRALVSPGTKIASVVKGNAYGHGMPEMIGILEAAVDYFQVDDMLELRELRGHTQKPALVLGYVAKDELEEAVHLGCELAVYDTERLSLLNRFAGDHGVRQRIHLKVDTFLGRQGVFPEQVDGFLGVLLQYPHLELAGIYSHFANIEDTRDFSHAQMQIDSFHEVTRLAGPKVRTHIS